MLQPTGSHARYIQAVLSGIARPDGVATPEYVKRSWVRCLSQYHLDPQCELEPYVLRREERLERKEQNAELLTLADAEMAHLYHQLAGSGYSIILTDREGVLLDYYGDSSFRNAAFRTGLVLGGVWSEQYGGTNGMGTCLVERAPLIIHRDQHFFARNTGLTCCAAPIFDFRGELLGVLDASGESDRAQQHTLVLVNMSAQMIENRLFLNRFRDSFVVRFHSRPELVGTWGEGIIALDASGTIGALDRNAVFQLGVKSAAELAGASLERVFNISSGALIARSQRKSFHPLAIYETRHGGRFYAVAQAPRSKPHAARPKRGGQASPAESGSAERPGRSVLDELDCGDPQMARNIQAVKRLESRDVPILLLGESGTGKEYFARALHAASDRADKPFVAVNCGALPAELLRAELFGRGPAGNDRGKIAQADGGTLFLDDAGDLPLELQGQLLHFLEEREILPPGAAAPITLDVRVVSAARGQLRAKVDRGLLREELLYRLQGLVLTMPPLRDRADKAALVRHFFGQESAATPGLILSEELVRALCTHSWPGNIRQLRNVLTGMVALRAGNALDIGSLPEDYGIGPRLTQAQPRELPPEAESLNPLEIAERSALLREIDIHRGNISRVAQTLGIGRNTLYRKMRRLKISITTRH
jgi:sigma-54 dependent transcriptional regulator, acetoin dehydrogenase operon transcriptional activator AcoR